MSKMNLEEKKKVREHGYREGGTLVTLKSHCRNTINSMTRVCVCPVSLRGNESLQLNILTCRAAN